MKTPFRLVPFRAGVLCTLFLTTAMLAQPAATGTIEGRVVNLRSGDYVERARITVEGTTLEAFTDTGGRYRLTQVPPGVATIKAFFTGFEVETATVPVAAGTIARHDFELGGSIVKLADFVVATSKEMDG